MNRVFHQWNVMRGAIARWGCITIGVCSLIGCASPAKTAMPEANANAKSTRTDSTAQLEIGAQLAVTVDQPWVAVDVTLSEPDQTADGHMKAPEFIDVPVAVQLHDASGRTLDTYAADDRNRGIAGNAGWGTSHAWYVFLRGPGMKGPYSLDLYLRVDDRHALHFHGTTSQAKLQSAWIHLDEAADSPVSSATLASIADSSRLDGAFHDIAKYDPAIRSVVDAETIVVFTENLLSGRYGSARRYFDADMKARLSEQQLANAIDPIRRKKAISSGSSFANVSWRRTQPTCICFRSMLSLPEGSCAI